MTPGSHLVENLPHGADRHQHGQLAGSGAGGAHDVDQPVSALVIAIGKIAISLLSAFAIVYFRFPFRQLCFWMIFVTLMLPVEVRILPTYKVVADLGMLNTYAGLTVPLIASATATFLFRQFFLRPCPTNWPRPPRIDGAGPMLLLRGRAGAAVATHRGAVRHPVHLRLEPVPLAAARDHRRRDVPIGHRHQAQMIGRRRRAVDWNVVMATAMLAMLPPPAGGRPDAEVVRQGPWWTQERNRGEAGTSEIRVR